MNRLPIIRQRVGVLCTASTSAVSSRRCDSNLGTASVTVPKSTQVEPEKEAEEKAEVGPVRVAHPVLDQFFDEPKNWEKHILVTGASWTPELLRRKSNADIHKLWFVLLKERNMLLTMEDALDDQGASIPCPERKFKVEESMAAIEEVVSERNAAVVELEEGKSAARPTAYVTSELGLKTEVELDEHAVPHWMNHKAKKQYELPLRTQMERSFEAHLRENEREIQRNKEDDKRRRRGLLKDEYKHISDIPQDDDFYKQNY